MTVYLPVLFDFASESLSETCWCDSSSHFLMQSTFNFISQGSEVFGGAVTARKLAMGTTAGQLKTQAWVSCFTQEYSRCSGDSFL